MDDKFTCILQLMMEMNYNSAEYWWNTINKIDDLPDDLPTVNTDSIPKLYASIQVMPRTVKRIILECLELYKIEHHPRMMDAQELKERDRRIYYDKLATNCVKWFDRIVDGMVVRFSMSFWCKHNQVEVSLPCALREIYISTRCSGGC